MINAVIELVDNEIIFTKQDIIDIFVSAYNTIKIENKYKFNEVYHNNNLTHNASDNGCNCYYCILRHKLRSTQLYRAKTKRIYNSIYYDLGKADRSYYIKKLEELKAQAKEIKKEKYLVKCELNLI